MRVQVRWHDARTASERSVSWVPIGFLSDDMKARAWVMLTGKAARGAVTRSSNNKQQTVQRAAKTEVPRMKPPIRASLQRGCKRQCVCYAENARQADMF